MDSVADAEELLSSVMANARSADVDGRLPSSL